MTPDLWDRITFCIFIASTTVSSWPLDTCCPTVTPMLITFPGMGEITKSSIFGICFSFMCFDNVSCCASKT